MVSELQCTSGWQSSWGLLGYVSRIHKRTSKMLRMHYTLQVHSRVSWYTCFGIYSNFKAVAYIPAFLEDRSAMVKERANGLYSVTAFLIANTIIGIPFLGISLSDSRLPFSVHCISVLHRVLLPHQPSHGSR